jgi:hypothetical protein
VNSLPSHTIFPVFIAISPRAALLLLAIRRCQVIPAHAMKAYRGSRGIAPLIPNLGAICIDQWSTPRPGSFLLAEEPRQQLNRTLWRASQLVWTFETIEKSLFLPQIRTPYRPVRLTRNLLRMGPTRSR